MRITFTLGLSNPIGKRAQLGAREFRETLLWGKSVYRGRAMPDMGQWSQLT